MSEILVPNCDFAGCSDQAVLVWLRFDDSTNTTVDNVYSCATHQINVDLAPFTHLSTCTAPDANLPNCNCTPVNTSVAI